MTNLNTYEADCLADAAFFTAVRGFGRNRNRAEFNTINEAIEHGKTFGDNKTMIYAVTHAGMTGHIQNA